MSPERFCTYCDKGYAARLLCLHQSLIEQGEAFILYVLCFDNETERVVRAAACPSLKAVALAELLAADVDYAAVRPLRSPIEFYFTTTPVFTHYCLQRDIEASRMTYLDADLYFFGPMSEVFAQQGEASIGIVPHRFPPHLRGREIYGIYNVAWVSFRRDGEGLACLHWWRGRCLEWCRDLVDNGRFADQGYLNEFPRKWANVKVLDHPGINAAPWNMVAGVISLENGQVWVNGKRLLFYHFQGVRELIPGWFEPGVRGYGNPLSMPLSKLIYEPYLRFLSETQLRLQAGYGIFPRFTYQRLNGGASLRDRWERFKARWFLPYYGRFRGQLIHCAPGRQSRSGLSR